MIVALTGPSRRACCSYENVTTSPGPNNGPNGPILGPIDGPNDGPSCT